MAIEIERKFLVVGNEWRDYAVAKTIRQGYLFNSEKCSVRVRDAGSDHCATLTIKSSTSSVICRKEYEYPIPEADAKELLEICGDVTLDKVRHEVWYKGKLWEIDEFCGDNLGLIVAEVELSHVSENVTLPPWIGAEVTDDPRYLNAMLVQNPYSRWKR